MTPRVLCEDCALVAGYDLGRGCEPGHISGGEGPCESLARTRRKAVAQALGEVAAISCVGGVGLASSS
jgi:hypothetical protein